VPGGDAAIELQDLCLERLQLNVESADARAGHLRDLGGIAFDDECEQLFDATAPDRRDDPELGKMSTD
jgi:hypothetical protein